MALTASTLVVVAATAAPSGPGISFVKHSEQGRGLYDSLLYGLGLPDGFSGQVLAVKLGAIEFAPGPGSGGFDEQIHVLQRATGRVLKIDALGGISTFTEVGSPLIGGISVRPTFDVLGAYTGSMVAGDTASGLVEVHAGGAVTPFELLEAPGHEIVALAHDSMGGFEGAMIGVDEAGWLHIVGMDGTLSLLATGLGLGPYAMAFGPDGALYVSAFMDRAIYRVAPDHAPGMPVGPWLDLTTLDIEPAGLALSESGAMGAGTVYVVDATAGRIVRFAADGTYLGPFVTGVPGQASLAVPAAGVFADSLLIEFNGCIFAISDDSPNP